MGCLGQILLPQALKSFPKCNETPNLVTLVERERKKRKTLQLPQIVIKRQTEKAVK